MNYIYNKTVNIKNIKLIKFDLKQLQLKVTFLIH